MISVNTPKRFIIVHLASTHDPLSEVQKNLAETYALVSALTNVEIVDLLLQRDDRPHQTTFIGSGKVGQIARRIHEEKIDVIVVNAIIKQRQVYALKRAFWKSNNAIDVWDRVDLILHIFQQHANTAEAKLQIRLAQMAHMGPRIYGLGKVMSQQGGGIGTLGIGETNTELMKRHWRSEMKKVNLELAKLADERENQIERRKKQGLITVSLIGYTNAGKSTIFNILSGKNTLVENALFATLDSHVGSFYLKALQKEITITDTIGFIRNLPTRLINAFHSTLLESLHADILLHVIDVSDPEMEKKIRIVRDVLHELAIDAKEQIFIFNKLDQAKNIEKESIANRYRSFHPLFLSAVQTESKEIRETIAHQIAQVLTRTFKTNTFVDASL